MEYNQLLEQNIWWKNKKEIKKDIHIKKFKNKKISWDPKLKSKLSFKAFSLNIVVGPRQVGKTTALKLMIRDLLKTYKPKQLFYFNCDELTDHKDLIKLIKSYLEIKPTGKSIIILDEITSPKNWTRAVKSLIDKGLLEEDILIITGSNSIRVKREAEFFPGRRGNGKDVLLSPLNFRKFVQVLNPKLISNIPSVNKLSHRKIMSGLSKSIDYKDELQSYFKKYLNYGGFPLAINSLKNEQKLLKAKRIYQDGFISDILKTGGDINITKEVISSIIEKIPSHFSYNKVGRDIGKSSKTIEKYLKLFQDIYSLVILNNIDLSSKSFKFGKNKKIHFLDPLMLNIFKDWCLSEKKFSKDLLAESALVSHLALLDFKHFSLGSRIGYWSNNTEIDAIIKGNNPLGFEVKWTNNKVNKSKYFKYSEHFKELYILTKNEYQPKNNIFPLVCFLTLIKKTNLN